MSGTQTDVGIKDSHNADSTGFEKPSRETYNLNHGRVATAHTVGGNSHEGRSAKGMPPKAPSSKRTPPLD